MTRSVNSSGPAGSGWETVRLPLGADAEDATAFLAHGMLINTLTVIRLPLDRREAKP